MPARGHALGQDGQPVGGGCVEDAGSGGPVPRAPERRGSGLPVCGFQCRQVHFRRADGGLHFPVPEGAVCGLRVVGEAVPVEVHQQGDGIPACVFRQFLPGGDRSGAYRRTTLRGSHHPGHRVRGRPDRCPDRDHRQFDLFVQQLGKGGCGRVVHDEADGTEEEARPYPTDHFPHAQTESEQPYHPKRPGRVQKAVQFL